MNKLLVHVRAPALTLSGYGVHSRQILDYLLEDDRFEVLLESINWGHTPFIHNHPNLKKYYECIYKYQKAKEQKVQCDLSVHVSIPNEFSRTARFNIALTAGIEVDRITKKWVEKCNEMDMLIVPSEFSKKVLGGTVYEWKNPQSGEQGELKVVKPIRVIHEWYEKKEPQKLDIKFNSDFNFLHVGQWGNKGGFGEDRKNIADMVRIFLETFHGNPDVGLVLKVNIINNSEEDFSYTKNKLEQIKSNYKDVKCHIHLIHDTLSEEEMWGLYTHPQIKALLSLTHGEGFGLPLLEAASAGLPVMATDWSGHVDFLRNKHGFMPLDYELVDIPECQVWNEVIDKGSRWAKVDEEHVKKRLRRFFNSPNKIIKQAKENVEWLKDNFSKDAIKEEWKEFFDDLIIEENSENGQVENSPALEQRNKAVSELKKLVEETDKEKVLYVMPRSAGDVLISTAIVNALVIRHSDCDFYFATTEPYKSLLDGLVHEHKIKVIDYHELMMHHELAAEVWDYVYNPGVNVQYNFSSWLIGNGEYSVRMLEEFAKNCNLSPQEIINYNIPLEDIQLPSGDYCTFSPGGIKSAKEYKYWQDVLDNVKEMFPEITIVQTGLSEERLYNGVQDGRGQSYAETLYLIKNAAFHFGIDTFTAHAAAAVDTPHFIIYGSTSAHTVTPVLLGKNKLQILMETADRHGCKNPCYKDQCIRKKDGKNCISEISPQAICNSIMELVRKMNEEEDESK